MDQQSQFDPAGLDLRQTTLLYEAICEGYDDRFDDEGLIRIGDYLVDEELGEGAGGRVFRALKPGSERNVTVKVLRTPLSSDTIGQRAWRKLDVLEQLASPVVPRLHEHGVHDGRLFLVYDHIDGLPLDAYCRTNDLDRAARVDLLIAVARAVQDLHERGLIHRDIKPGNVLVTREGRPYLIDLGLATLIDEDAGPSPADEGQLVGTVPYLSPEQANGDRSGVSTRSDVFSLGATAFAIVLGQTPHDMSGDRATVLRRVRTHDARPARQLDPQLPATLAAILDRAVARDPRDRYDSAAAFADDLERWRQHRPTSGHPPSWWRWGVLAIRRQPRRWALGLGAAIVALAVTGVTTVVQAQHVRERLALLDELQQKQDRIDRYLAIVAMVSDRFTARLDDRDFAAALQWMKRLEDHVVAAGGVMEVPDVPDMSPEALTAMRDRLARNAITITYSEDEGVMSNEELAAACVRALYHDSWNETLAREVRRVLENHEQEIDD